VRRGSIEPGTPLAVDPSSGQVRVVGDLDSLVAQKVNIRVVATDAGTPAMSTTGVLKLVLKHPELDATHHRDQTSRRRAAGNRQQTGSSFWIPLGSVATKPEVVCGWRWWKGNKPEVVCGYYWGGGGNSRLILKTGSSLWTALDAAAVKRKRYWKPEVVCGSCWQLGL